MKKTRTLILIAIAVMFLSTAVFATVAWSKLFVSTYSPKADGALVKAKCQLCHMKKMADGLNPYGKAMKGKKVEAASLKAIEKLDSDKDGATNIAEIKAGTLPGDKTSKPAPAKKPAKPKPPVKKK